MAAATAEGAAAPGCARCGSYDGAARCQGQVLCREHRYRDSGRLALEFLLGTVVVAALHGATVGHPVAAALLTLPVLAALAVVQGVLQAAVSALPGLRVERLTVGTGRRLLSWRAGRLRVEVRAVPFGSSVEVLASRTGWAPSRGTWLAMGVIPLLVLAAVAAAGAAGGGSLGAAAVAAGTVTFAFAALTLPGATPPAPRPAVVAPDGTVVPYAAYAADADAVRAALAANDVARAAAALRRLRALQPDEDFWQVAEVVLLGDEQRWEEARALARPLRDGRRGVARARLDAILAEIGGVTGTDLDEAADAARAALRTLGEVPGLVEVAALVAARHGRLDEAAALCARHEPPPSADAHAIRAFVARQRGDHAAAARHVAAARAIDPDEPYLVLLG